MCEQQIRTLAGMIRDALGAAGSVAAAAAVVERRFRDLGMWECLAPSMPEARAMVERDFAQIEILHDNSMRASRPQWYHGPKEGDRNWPVLKRYLRETKNWSAEAVGSIDQLSSEVVSLLENPARAEFDCRGMVVGYVQSGKTANMTGVIAKAVDCGYNMVIVLAGLTNKLRQQTQGRMESDLISRNPEGWHRLTTTDENGDFQLPAHGALMHLADRAQIAVVKKNVSPLRKLLEAIGKTVPVELRRLRVLIIDDECDQASPNAAPDEMKTTAINAKIREILGRLPASTYVGYTATPFANVFINPFPMGDDRPDDLYPKDFITALPEPAGYFGAAQLFGRPTDDAQDEDAYDGLDMIRPVPEEEEAVLQPSSASDREDFSPQMCPSLEAAILHFLAACALRRERGQGDQHMTMLVHTSMYVALHDSIASLIRLWKGVHEGDLAAGTGAVSERLRAGWREERGRVPAPEGAELDLDGELDAIFRCLPGVLNNLDTPVENGASEDRIDYEGEPKTYIVVGGSVLARGLTLEGLMVSYFLRAANQYDTLLQMGRWFGYRFGYADLPRIWMPEALAAQFRALAGIEAEIREDISVYREANITPMDFAVRVRAIPGMAITAATKMRAAERTDVSYWGRHVQTFRFDHRNEVAVAGNWAAATELVNRIEGFNLRAPDTDRKLWLNVPKDAVLRFLERYRMHPNHQSQFGGMLPEFIRNANARLGSWSVGVYEPRNGPESAKTMGGVGVAKLMQRSQLKESSAQGADLKAIMSRADIVFDCPGIDVSGHDDWEALKQARRTFGRDNPMLLLYPIDRNSRAKPDSKTRKDLDAVGDLIGVGILFPGSITGAGDYYAVQVDRSMQEDDEAAAAEFLEAAEAAHAV